MRGEALRAGVARRKKSSKLFMSEKEREASAGGKAKPRSPLDFLDEAALDEDGRGPNGKKLGMVHLLRLLQEDYKRVVRESEFREQQLSEYQQANRRIADEAGRLQQRFNLFRARKNHAMSELARTVIDEGGDPARARALVAASGGGGDEDLMARIHRLQAQEIKEMARMQAQIDEYERRNASAKGSSSAASDVSSSDLSSSSDEDDDDSLDEDEILAGSRTAGGYDTIDPRALRRANAAGALGGAGAVASIFHPKTFIPSSLR